MKRIIIMGAAGRDFHNFNICYKNNPDYQVVAFTATQIPGIENRIFPSSLAGERYPEGIPIYPEEKLINLIEEKMVDEVIFAYSDVSHAYLMHKASAILAAGADFRLLGSKSTMIKANLPVIAITASRTGSGKSQVARYIAKILVDLGMKPVIIRHPMPYGILEKQKVQRFATYEDLVTQKCTVEEREEYEPHIDAGFVVYAGIDYEAILEKAETEGDIIIWDGGNNDFPFYVPDMNIVVIDPLRVGTETSYYPGETNLIRADIVIINKVNSADPRKIKRLKTYIPTSNPDAIIMLTNSIITVDKPELIQGKKVLVVEDGPTITHGKMSYGAGAIAAETYGAGELLNPHDFAVGSIAETLRKWTHINNVLPAMGYNEKQVDELEKTIEKSGAELVIVGTPVDLSKIINIKQPVVRVKYELEEIEPQIKDLIQKVFFHMD